MIKVAIMGHGVVGCGVAEVLRTNAAHIAKKVGDTLEVARILDLREFPDSPYAQLFTKQFDDIVTDETIRIVVETMGGLHPAYEYVKACLLAGKSVVTSNKELVAQKGDELLQIAKDNGLHFLFEASVGGGIPIIRPLNNCLAANEICEIAGILNGTTNFMLTKMIDDGMDFDEALALAQQLGYAERDPSADVDGLDACRKICILASLAYGVHVYPDTVATTGIRNVTLEDVQYAAAWGGVIKLLGHATKRDDKVYCSVAPRIISKDHMLAGVKDVFNAVMVKGDAVGEVLFYGKGAGKLPTASAVVADVIDVARHLGQPSVMFWEATQPDYAGDAACTLERMLVRVKGANTDALWNAVHTAFPEAERVTPTTAKADECGFVTAPITAAQLEQTVTAMQDVTLVSYIRVSNM